MRQDAARCASNYIKSLKMMKLGLIDYLLKYDALTDKTKCATLINRMLKGEIRAFYCGSWDGKRRAEVNYNGGDIVRYLSASNFASQINNSEHGIESSDLRAFLSALTMGWEVDVNDMKKVYVEFDENELLVKETLKKTKTISQQNQDVVINVIKGMGLNVDEVLATNKNNNGRAGYRSRIKNKCLEINPSFSESKFKRIWEQLKKRK